MNIKENITNKGLYKFLVQSTYDIGLKGQDFVELKFKNRGYVVYKKNLKKIGLEIDLIVYKYIPEKKLLVIRIVEVKTKRIKTFHAFMSANTDIDLEQFDIGKKWVRVKNVMFDIINEIKSVQDFKDVKHKVSFDLTIVHSLLGTESFKIHRYIENVDLLL